MVRYTKHFNLTSTPQTQPIPGRTDMVKNNAGGYGWKTSSMQQLERFLILGSEGGTYYVSEHNLTVDNAKNTIKALKESGVDAVRLIRDVSVGGKAPKNDAAIFALALACKFGDTKTRSAAYSAIPSVCRIGTHLFTFVQNIQELDKGWGRGLRRGVAKFYTEPSVEKLAYQVVKYRQRNGWTHRDVLRLSHAFAGETERNNVLAYAVGKIKDFDSVRLPSIIQATEEMKGLSHKSKTDLRKAINLIQEYRLPREAIPTEFLTVKDVWAAMLPSMPITAMIRNLGKMSNIGLLETAYQDEVKMVADRIANEEVLRRGRVHPLFILNAMKNYSNGHGFKGSMIWNPVNKIVDAMDEAFYLAFGSVEPTGKNLMLALDISGSMSWDNIAGMQMTPKEASAAMALITAATEPNHEIYMFDHKFQRAKITPRMRLAEAVQAVSRAGFGGTNCALPMQFATKNKLPIDAFVIYTDNETWAGQGHCSQALKSFRKTMAKPAAKFVSVGMTATSSSLSDPRDPGMLDIVGFNTDTPSLMSKYIAEM